MLREITEKESGFLLLSWGIGLLIAIILTKILDKNIFRNRNDFNSSIISIICISMDKKWY